MRRTGLYNSDIEEVCEVSTIRCKDNISWHTCTCTLCTMVYQKAIGIVVFFHQSELQCTILDSLGCYCFCTNYPSRVHQ